MSQRRRTPPMRQTARHERESSAAPPPSHEEVVARLLASPAFADAMLRAIDQDPLTALHVATEHGLILYSNDQAARAFLGKGVKGTDAMGYLWSDLFPAPLVEERLQVLRDILADGKPRYVRSIYFGLQVITRYDMIGALPGVAGGERVFLCVTRHEPRTLGSNTLDGVTVVEPKLHHLGPLARLTPRELELLALVAEGMSITEIAETLQKSVHTVNEQRLSLGRKLGAQDRVRLAEIARDAGLKRSDIHLSSIEHLEKPVAKSRTEVLPRARLKEVGCATPSFRHALWRALNDDPFTAFQVLQPDSTMLHVNLNVVRIFVPELGKVDALLGKRYDEVAPRSLVQDRMDIIRSVAQFHRARFQRSIYGGVQTITRLEYASPIPEAGAPKGMVLLASRPTPADVVARLPAHARRLIVTPHMHRMGAIASLSPREREVLALIGEGLSNKQIAQRLHRTEDTVEDHRRKIGIKLKISDRVKLADVARQAGLTVEDADRPSLNRLGDEGEPVRPRATRR